MNLIIIILSSFFLMACGVESQRQLSYQSAVSGVNPRQTLLKTKWRDLDLDLDLEKRSCLSSDCASFLIVVSFTEKSLIQTGLDKITKKVVKQKLIPINLINAESFVLSQSGTAVTFQISGHTLTLCEQGLSCSELTLYQ
jgi:hypothetical protein